MKPVGGDDVEDSDDDVVQTLMELDYETFIDDEEEDEFQNFKASLEGTLLFTCTSKPFLQVF